MKLWEWGKPNCHTFETKRPSLPKVVYIGGIQWDAPKLLEGQLKELIDPSSEYKGFILFSLGGIVDTEILSLNFVKIFLDVFREIP